jgi:hypothetical protein
MKGYLKVCVGVLAFCMIILITGCADDPNWGTGIGGMPLNPDGGASVPTGETPPGSGAVDYVPQTHY